MNSVTVNFEPSGPRVVCIPVGLVDDSLLEGEESFPLQINSVSPTPGVVMGDQNTTTVFIRDDDSKFILNWPFSCKTCDSVSPQWPQLDLIQRSTKLVKLMVL